MRWSLCFVQATGLETAVNCSGSLLLPPIPLPANLAAHKPHGQLSLTSSPPFLQRRFCSLSCASPPTLPPCSRIPAPASPTPPLCPRPATSPRVPVRICTDVVLGLAPGPSGLMLLNELSAAMGGVTVTRPVTDQAMPDTCTLAAPETGDDVEAAPWSCWEERGQSSTARGPLAMK